MRGGQLRSYSLISRPICRTRNAYGGCVRRASVFLRRLPGFLGGESLYLLSQLFSASRHSTVRGRGHFHGFGAVCVACFAPANTGKVHLFE